MKVNRIPVAPIDMTTNPSLAAATTAAVGEVQLADSGSEDEACTNPRAKHGFLIVYEGKKGRLHRSSGCWHSSSRRVNHSQWFEQMPEEALYHATCKLCWPIDNPEEAVSGSDTASSAGEDTGETVLVDD